MKIHSIFAREILDSRGNPTVEAEVQTQRHKALAAVPSGASTGSLEAHELRDGGNRYMGKGVQKAISHITHDISRELNGIEADKQAEIDSILINLDGSEQKSRLGANAILAVSLACAKAAALAKNMPFYQYVAQLHQGNEPHMPVPMMNIINGGAHANNTIDFQEFMIQPVGFDSFSRALQCGVEIFHNLKQLLQKRGDPTTVGDEGGFAPNLPTADAALEVIAEATQQAGYALGSEVVLALDCAASEFYADGSYKVENKQCSSGELTTLLGKLADSYPISSIEDGLAEDDWQGWKKLTEKLGNRIQLVGDDLFVTNSKILQKGIDAKVANAILIKINQIGSLSETLTAIRLAQQSGYHAVVSHRSGETEDVSIADIAVGAACGQIKTGSLSRTDRVAKYNQLIRIEEQLGTQAHYPGIAAIGCSL